MMEQKLSILVIGAGGIGGITAARMINAGLNVEVVDNLPGLADKIEKEGIDLFGHTEPLKVKIPAYQSISEVPGKRDVILLATKATALCSVAKEIQPLLKEESAVVSLQNGICEEYLIEKVGKEHLIGCVVGWGATVHEPGKLEKTSAGNFTIGTIDGGAPKHFESVVKMLETTAPVVVSENILGCLYSKLIINSCITTLGAICGMTLGKMFAIKKIRRIFIGIIREAVAVGRAAEIKIEKYAGKLDFYNFADESGLWAGFMKHLKIRVIGMKYRRLKSSSLQSLETGRKTEIDFLNGYIAQKGRERHVKTPLNDLLVKLVKEIEDGKRAISYSNFELDLFNRY
ncbi:MAG: 2-dehydropantoate 2-reductase [Bacteroidota bacterium]